MVMVIVELFRDNLLAVLAVVLLLLVLAFFAFRPRQRVRLTDSTPLRPHMSAKRENSVETSGFAHEAATVTNEIIGAPPRRQVPGGAEADDFLRLKGVGPRLSELIHARGFTRFDQLAHLTSQEVELLDQQLGPFAGRIKRDRIVEQSAFLARGDVDGFEEHFGKL
ncbi:MAG: hypothetical protein ABIW03_05515 [Sphingomicrobium sp.]